MIHPSAMDLCLAVVLLVTTSAWLFLVSQEDKDMFEQGDQVNEECEGMPDIVTVTHPH